MQLAAASALSVQTDLAAISPSVHILLVAASRANSVGLTLFGCYCLMLGWLVARSSFIPKFLGWLLMVSGTTWLAGNLTLMAEPRLAGQFLLVVGLAAVGEIIFALWLLLKGVDESRWNASARKWESRA
jgi:hypothetical protein